MLPDSNDARPIGERLLQDRRSTSELVEAALGEADRGDYPPDGHYSSVAVLHERGTRDVLDAALALCGSPDPRRRALGAKILGVAFALCGSDRPASVRALLEMMEDRNFEVRDWATTGIGGTVSLDGPEIRAALLRRATDTDEITRAEALHGLAHRGDRRVVPYLIAELSAEPERVRLFVDAAKTFVSIDEDTKVDSDVMLASLRAVWSDV